ncbi:MAG: MFS transporter [Ignavibacteriae bacterium HGW-Ignavibacteriae-1]|jgi:POT family proton-dependent oligopeptide transporter|nr:MAG: MFS transporter [Ignavibacteriae bacterium HGW-Ignavibacteriae-1]
MFKNHPKGLIVAFFANMGERFGFYTMMAILVLFLQAKFGLAADDAGIIYSVFYTLIYALALVGGFLADRTQNYKGIILIGIVIMFLGYAIMATPGTGLVITLLGLFTISLGNGLFKGNLQALVGQMYDAPQYAHLRDSAFSIFYMGINIGAFFAPTAANGIRNWFLKSQGYTYDADLPALAHKVVNGQPVDMVQFQELATNSTTLPVTDLTVFAQNYIDVFAVGYNYAFGVAAVAMLISLVVYIFFKGKLPDRKKQVEKGEATIQMAPAEERQRLIALGLVFLVVIFFWMSFHQNGLTLTYFARDYTAKTVDAFTYLFFDLRGFLPIIAAILGMVFLVKKGSETKHRIIGGALVVVGSALAYYFYGTYSDSNVIEPELFQQFNPIFIVFLTPVVVWFFGWLKSRKSEPSTPRKIGIGMILAAFAFMVLLLGSLGLVSPAELDGAAAPGRVSPYWLINTYLILTIAELFLSPMGISFVSKVSPPRFQGLMQGGWLGATAVGNQLLFVGSFMWMRIEVWQVWAIFVVCCMISAVFVFSIMKKLENATGK